MSSIYDPKYDPSFCEKLKDWATYEEDGETYGTTITQLCAWHLKISRQAYYDWKNNKPEFARAANEFESLSQAHEESIANKGSRGKIHGYNSVTHMFNMKNRYRECYGELGVNVPHPTQKSQDEMKKEAELLEQHEREY